MALGVYCLLDKNWLDGQAQRGVVSGVTFHLPLVTSGALQSLELETVLFKSLSVIWARGSRARSISLWVTKAGASVDLMNHIKALQRILDRLD